MKLYDIKNEWRTDTVRELCRSMREAQDWSAMPILADALQDVGCDAEDLLAKLRGCDGTYAERAGLVGCVLSAETEEAVRGLVVYRESHDCPEFATLVNAATGNHHENTDPDQPGYVYTSNYEEFLHFNGTDAHGEIPADFWELVQKATGAAIPQSDRASYFSCSC